MAGLVAVESKVMTTATQNYGALFAKWLEFAQVKPASVASYTKGVKNFFAFVQAAGVSEINRDVLLSYREHLGATYRAATANLYLTATKLFVSFLHQEGVIATDVADRIKNFKVSEEHAKDALSAETTRKIIASFDVSTLRGKRDAAIYTTMTSCGLRCVEVARANVGDIVPRGEKFFLQVQGKGRDDKRECVELPPGVYKLIRNYLDERGKLSADMPLFASVSHRNNAERLTTNSISRLIKGILRANGIDSERVTAHSLRHTCANTMITNGVELRRVQEVLRHKSVRVTERYLHELDRYNNGGESVAAKAFGL